MLENSLTNNVEQSEFSVSEISSRIKLLLENNIGTVRIKGEISGLKIASSGHGYFSLKDSNAILSATCWRHNLARVNFKLEEGLEVIVSGKITSYSGQSKYQISADSITPSGDGAFMQILKARKAALEKEGLFSKDNKKPIPFLPKKIGIITSITGAVIKDIIHRISDRCPSHLVIWPTAVQGESAHLQVSAAIDGFNNMPHEQKPDLLIIARGGGSIEDLWAFNEENVVRSIHASSIPIISAIGHETDYSLADLASDVRAPTPTAAAEFAVPVLLDLKYTLTSLQNRMNNKLNDFVKYYSNQLKAYDSLLNRVKSNIDNYSQKIDDLSFRLSGSLPNLIHQKKKSLSYFPITRISPLKILEYKYMQYKHLASILLNKKNDVFSKQEHRLNINSSLLASLDYNKVLQRGYAMVKNHNGNYISYASEISNNSDLTIQMQDGEVKILRSN